GPESGPGDPIGLPDATEPDEECTDSRDDHLPPAGDVAAASTLHGRYVHDHQRRLEPISKTQSLPRFRVGGYQVNSRRPWGTCSTTFVASRVTSARSSCCPEIPAESSRLRSCSIALD